MARISIIAPDFFSERDKILRLEAKGHKVTANPDPARAMEALLDDPPDLLIIQRNLPCHFDRDVVLALKNNLSLALLPVLLVVHKKDLSDGLDWNQYPVDDLIPLDSSLEEVITRVELALARTHRVADNNPLTGLPGNSSILKAIQGFLDQGLDRAVAYVDIDNFKPYNDNYGHQQGDDTLRAVLNALAGGINRPGDLLARYGGEEFVVVLPDTTMQGAGNLAKLLRERVNSLDIEHGFSKAADHVTVSMGVACCEPEKQYQSPAELIEAADKALYEAKKAGRNRIELSSCYAGKCARSQASG